MFDGVFSNIDNQYWYPINNRCRFFFSFRMIPKVVQLAPQYSFEQFALYYPDSLPGENRLQLYYDTVLDGNVIVKGNSHNLRKTSDYFEYFYRPSLHILKLNERYVRFLHLIQS